MEKKIKAQAKRDFSTMAIHSSKSQSNRGQVECWDTCVCESMNERKGAYRALQSTLLSSRQTPPN